MRLTSFSFTLRSRIDSEEMPPGLNTWIWIQSGINAVDNIGWLLSRFLVSHHTTQFHKCSSFSWVVQPPGSHPSSNSCTIFPIFLCNSGVKSMLVPYWSIEMNIPKKPAILGRSPWISMDLGPSSLRFLRYWIPPQSATKVWWWCDGLGRLVKVRWKTEKSP